MNTEGEKFRSIFTGKEYQVRKIEGKMVILETENGACQVMTDRANLKLFYKKEEKKNGG